MLQLKSFLIMKMFEKCNSLKRCGSTLITIPWNIFRGSLNGLNIYTASRHIPQQEGQSFANINATSFVTEARNVIYGESIFSEIC